MKLDGKAFYKLFKKIFASPYNDGIKLEKLSNITPELLDTDKGLYQVTYLSLIFVLGYAHGTQDTIEICRDEPKALAFLNSDTMKQLKMSSGHNTELRQQCFNAIKRFMDI